MCPLWEYHLAVHEKDWLLFGSRGSVVRALRPDSEEGACRENQLLLGLELGISDWKS